MEPRDIAKRLHQHHQRAFERYLAAERAVVIGQALEPVADRVLIARRDAARHVAAGYAELIAQASASGASG
jgi:hypothetical protein